MDLYAAEMAVRRPFEEVGVNQQAADRVIEADAGLAARHMLAAADVTPAIEADHHAAVRGIAPHVDAALVVRLLDHMVHVVVLDQVVVALDAHGAGRRVVEVVVRDARAAAFQQHGGVVGAGAAAEMMDLVVFDQHLTGGEVAAVAAADVDAGVAQRVQPVAVQLQVRAVRRDDRAAAQPTDHAAGDGGVDAGIEYQPVLLAVFKGQSLEDDVTHLVRLDEGLVPSRKHQRAEPRVTRRPDIQAAGLAVHVPLAGPVDLFQQVEDVERVVGAHAVSPRALFEGQGAGCGVDPDRHGADCPEVIPVAVGHDILGLRPARQALGGEAEDTVRRIEHRAGHDRAAVRPARDGQGLAVFEQLAHRFVVDAVAETLLGRERRIALRLEVGHPHLAARFGRQPREHGLVAHGPQTAHAEAAVEDRPFVAPGAIDHGCAAAAGVDLG